MELKSKTKRKKEAEALQELGEELVRLTPAQIRDIPLPSEISEAVAFAKTLKRGALRRQLQYIGTLMRQYDTAPIQEALQNIQDGDYKKAAVFQELEEWRTELMEGNEALMEDILRRHPTSDRQQLTQLVRNAVKERENNKPPRAFRDLFRYLKKIRSERSDI
jgi:ribosome-associated protein